MPYTLSIEETAGKSRQHGFHLGTIERIARDIIQDKMRCCVENGWPAVTMALMDNGKIVDVLYRDGKWDSEADQTDYDMGPNGEIWGFPK